MANAAVSAAGPVVEKFAASAGRWLGLFGVAVALIGPVAIVDDGFSSGLLRGTLIGFAIAIVSWVVLVRPSVAVHQNGVLLRNMAHDAFVPSSKIDRCRSSQTLMIRAGEDTFHGLGVGRSARSVMREKRRAGGAFQGFQGMTGGFGPSPASGLAVDEPTHRFADQEQIGVSYTEYVATRIEQLRSTVKDDDREPVSVWAWESVTALVAAVVFVVVAIVA